MKLLPILVCYLFLGTCQRSLSAKDAAPLSACYAVPGTDGFDDLICDGKPIKQRPGPAGPKGDRGANGGTGPQGPAGSGGGSREVSLICQIDWPNATRVTIKYILFADGDGTKEAVGTLSTEEAVFSNSATYLKDDPLAASSPLDIQEFSLVLSGKDLTVIFRPNGRRNNFPCN